MQLRQSFFRRPVVEVARALVGKEIRTPTLRAVITETEAYRQDDSACHAFGRRTARNATLFGPPGTLYVYLCYGLHQMLNLVTGDEGWAAAVLVRACVPRPGFDEVLAERRRGRSGPGAMVGPGNVGAALDVHTSMCGLRVYRRGASLQLHDAPPPARIVTGPRVGIDYATPEDRALPWRFADGTTRHVSRPRIGG